jgi:hypothetical protein
MKEFNKQDIKNILNFLEEEGSLDDSSEWTEEPNFSYLTDEVVQRERLNEETTYKCEICNKEKEDHEMCIITDVDLISKQYVCQNCLNGIK